jgi:hypothetical protein
MFKDFLRNNAAVLVVAGISLAISFLIAGSTGDVWAPHRGR